MTLESPGVVELDTSVVPDVLGMRALYRERQTDSGASRSGPEQCLSARTGHQSDATGVP